MIERPAARYGSPEQSRSNRRWILFAVAAVAVVVGVVAAVVTFQRFGSNEVKGELTGYELLDDETVQVTIGVERPDPSKPVVCIVRARSKDGSETGRREILVPPSTDRVVQVTTEVKSTRKPVMGDIYGCGTDVPSYLVTPQK
ncbi:DUF4307 domain-containing protein [Mycolicibacterium goodii]|uniref:DUF4307 domain-containing protein n=1 Tax=Mycolicibacterium goodii TaxID=134601 RepID=UPI001BDD7A4D|nr:DUF4307 domain-containing protein [Mycolicibacterium goodii]MBU8834295.1 DUF4307 domain-containing protein [Mycolicibacterium goodii]ULN46391.1 DUF4307 domain-containing protein [Mycolicibacterium goodii]